MAEADEKFHLIRQLFLEFPRGEWEGLEYSFIAEINDGNKALLEALNDLGMLIGAREIAVGQERKLTFLSEQRGSIFIARTIDDLLVSNTYKSKSPERVFLTDPEDYLDQNNEPEGYFLQSYKKVVDLVNIISGIADHEDKSSGERSLIFLSSEKIEIPVRYTISDFHEWDRYQDFFNLFSDRSHEKQKITVFKTVLSEALRDVDENERFSYFLTNFDRLVTRVLQNYELYVSEFSFEKVRKKNKEEIAQHLVRINAVFSDIQAQLLTLPIAGLLAAGQMESGPSNALKNGSIVIAALSFALLLSFVLRNYFSSLRTVKNEIDAQKSSLKEEYKIFANSFEQDYEVVDRRYESQLWLGRMVDFAVSVALVIVPTLLFIYINSYDFVEIILSHSFYQDSLAEMKLKVFSLLSWIAS